MERGSRRESPNAPQKTATNSAPAFPGLDGVLRGIVMAPKPPGAGKWGGSGRFWKRAGNGSARRVRRRPPAAAPRRQRRAILTQPGLTHVVEVGLAEQHALAAA